MRLTTICLAWLCVWHRLSLVPEYVVPFLYDRPRMSIASFLQLKGGALSEQLRKVLTFCRRHFSHCPHCRSVKRYCCAGTLCRRTRYAIPPSSHFPNG